MIKWVYDAAKNCPDLDEVIVATDDKRIADVVGRAEMTGEHETGTDRIAEVARRHPADIVVNIQGDKPFIRPEDLSKLIREFHSDMGVMIHPLKEGFEDYSVVKAVIDLKGYLLYASRYPIPYKQNEGITYQSGGIYIFTGDFLQTFTKLKPTPLQQTESLEQLRALEHGYKIQTIYIDKETFGVDTPEDLEKANGYKKKEGRGPKEV